ncbi:hypothetical protein E1A91_D13G106300v1 [Gossypium mustelinum]|uniref:Uncharacterized protein n=2 Tax=Gossypium TaxID=3633 RepID=A0A0D2VA87_GOSRA|nr:uncharacterized protein LOC105774282 isoform X1 [Gossypium raimondii]KJB66420.1 hypothetical protein B456_010G139600 [Gossypium raimondii]TYI46423.1 hypothetical protein E1A91_D13G106300v1 [Gossypium mustelinum]
MANPRRNSYSTNQSVDGSFQSQTQSSSSLSSLKHLLKKPHALPFLLLLLLLLTWVSLRLQYSSRFRHQQLGQDGHGDDDSKANLVRFKSGLPSAIVKDKRGWLLDPVSLALQFGVRGLMLTILGGAVSCSQVHIGEIRRGDIRGNHRHYSCNETFVIWGAKTKFRLENNQMDGRGYAEVTIGEDEVVVAASPSGTAHALVNVDALRNTYFVGCQDGMVKSNSSNTDFNVWKNL